MANGIKVMVVGALGKMGTETIKAVKADAELDLVGCVDVKGDGVKISTLTNNAADNGELFTDLDEALDTLKPDVMIDFTNPQAVFPNARTALKKAVHCIIGTTGLGEKELATLDQLARENNIGVAVIPNFAVGAILMMKFAAEAAKYFKDVEIIELHHDGKLDAPSGTAIKTAEMIYEKRLEEPSSVRGEFEKVSGVRGGKAYETHIHSIRLPGFVAHQEVIFGSLGQTLTIRHDSINRECFMPGVIMSVKRIQKTQGLTYGLEHFM
ncbi:MAG: 4-hydroxy-tetrahydrodipicolinate reductase [Candidatus Saccharibacteria bacterium]